MVNIKGSPVDTINTSTPTSFTEGSVPFSGNDGTLQEDNSNLFWDDANNRLGIGTNSPDTKLEVRGNITIDGGGLVNSVLNINGSVDSYIRSTATDLFQIGHNGNIPITIKENGNVGIGTATPDANAKLTATDGNSYAYLGGYNDGGNDYAGYFVVPTSSETALKAVGGFGVEAQLGFQGSLAGYFADSFNGMYAELAGYDAGGSISAGYFYDSYYRYVRLMDNNSGYAIDASDGIFYATMITGYEAGYFSDGSGNYLNLCDGTYAINASGDVTIDGDVGIGTDSPSYPLDVVGRVQFSGDDFSVMDNFFLPNLYSDYTNSRVGIQTGTPNNTLTVNGDADFTGNVGIGTDSPSQLLHIESTTGNARVLTKTKATGNYTAAQQIISNDSDLFFGAADDAYTDVPEYAGKPFVQGNGGNFALVAQSGDIEFYSGGRASGNKNMVLDSNGNLGIGTNSPDELLHLEATSGSGVREVLMKATVSDAGNDAFGVVNGTSFNSNFAPTFWGYKDSAYSSGYIYHMNFRGLVPTAQDLTNSLDFGVINFETFTTSSATDPNNNLVTALSNRTLMTFRNGSDVLLQLDPDGSFHVPEGGATFGGSVGINDTSPSATLAINVHGGTDYSPYTSSFEMGIGVAANTSNISGLDFKNFASGGQVRFMARSNDDSYVVMNAPSTSVTGSWFGCNRNQTHFLWTAAGGGTAKKLAIGTLGATDLVLGTNDTARITVDGSTGDVTTTGDFIDLNGSGNAVFSGTTSVLTVNGTAFPAVVFNVTQAGTGTGQSAFRLQRNQSGALDGDGTGFIYTINNDAGQAVNTTGLYSYLDDVSDGAEVASWGVSIGGSTGTLSEVMRVNRTGLGIGTNSPTNALDVNSDSIRVRTAKTPSSASDTGTQGQIAWDSNYIYVCTATNTWVRAALSTW